VYLVDSELLWKTLAQVDDHNRQGELYLTSIVEIAVREGVCVEVLMIPDGDEAIGVNQRAELAQAAAVLRERKLNQLMLAGVSIVDPAATWIDMDAEIGRDCVIEPGCVIQGNTRLGERVHLKPGCTIEASEIGDDSVLGPNAHLRPGTRLGRKVRIGNFVEVKNSVLGDGAKADHLSYIGDADVGAGASFGCGSIVVNYDGVAKHRTQVGARAFIGCNVNLVAPLRIAEDAFVAAGSTITKDVPALALAVARGKQQHIEGWVARRRSRSTPAHGDAQPPAAASAAAKTKAKPRPRAGSRASKPRTTRKPKRAR
jgi:bifunctional UDP-N-acetylglucosamine pyrophosphorylase/glucosamine-1-phosphate N-acetyltransferase